MNRINQSIGIKPTRDQRAIFFTLHVKVARVSGLGLRALHVALVQSVL